MKYVLDTEKFYPMFSEEQVKHYMKENKLTELETLLYLWAFNNFSVHYPDDLEDLGRPMYIKLAKKLAKLLEQSNEHR